ncbi:MAG: DUF6788 family protein [Terriglobia bacterium]
MPDALSALEADRSHLPQEFLCLGDLRPGPITAVVRRCGKPTCHCAKPHDPGHDPQILLTRRVAGKTVTENFPSPAAFRKAQKEVAEFRRFQKLSSVGSLWRVTLQARAHRGGPGGSLPPLRLVPALSGRPIPRRSRTGHRQHGIPSRECAACRPWWARRRLSIVGGNK